MGDYGLGHFNFVVKKSAPKEFLDVLHAFVKGDQHLNLGGKELYLGSSAYHPEETYAFSNYVNGDDNGDFERRYSMTFQVKWGWDEFEEFARWVEPHVVVDERNGGFIGYRMSEYEPTLDLILASDVAPLSESKI